MMINTGVNIVKISLEPVTFSWNLIELFDKKKIWILNGCIDVVFLEFCRTWKGVVVVGWSFQLKCKFNYEQLHISLEKIWIRSISGDAISPVTNIIISNLGFNVFISSLSRYLHGNFQRKNNTLAYTVPHIIIII